MEKSGENKASVASERRVCVFGGVDGKKTKKRESKPFVKDREAVSQHD